MIEARAVVVGQGSLPQPILVLIRLGKKFISGNFPLGITCLALQLMILRLERLSCETVSLAVGANHLTHVPLLS